MNGQNAKDVVYHSSKKGLVILCEKESTASGYKFIGRAGNGEVTVQQLGPNAFNQTYLKAEKNGRLYPVIDAAVELLRAKPNTAATQQLERIVGMDTRGKSTEQIKAEIARISVELPKGHALRAVPAKFDNRGEAIAHYTAVRQAIYQLTKESDMGSKKAVVDQPVPAQQSAGDQQAELAAKGKAKKGRAGTPENTQPVQAEATEAPVKGKGKKAAAEPKAKAEAEPKAKKGRPASNGSSLTGPFKLASGLGDAKTPEDLGMHSGSARYKLMELIFKSKSAKGVTMDAITAAVGSEQAKQAVMTCLKRGRIEAA